MHISYSKWQTIPLYLRAKIALEFGISKVRSTHVSNDVVLDDGYDLKTIESVLTKETLQSFLNSKEEDINILLDRLVDWADGKIPEQAPVVEEEPLAILPKEEAEQFKAEFEERTGIEAPKTEEFKSKKVTKKTTNAKKSK